MNVQEVMATLESLGTEQNRKVYGKHGAGENVFGVSFADLEKLRKRIKKSQPLAAELWKTGNYDACNLATLIADPASMNANDLDVWARRIDNNCMASLFARHIASKTPFAMEMLEKWTASKNEYIGEAGYNVLAWVAKIHDDTPDAYFEEWLTAIDVGIHQAPNRVRLAMNSALIAIGLRNAALQKLALAAAARIGKVHVDHGDTGCKTPDAAAYILKAAPRTKK